MKKELNCSSSPRPGEQLLAQKICLLKKLLYSTGTIKQLEKKKISLLYVKSMQSHEN